jgi:hypothetical protein
MSRVLLDESLMVLQRRADRMVFEDDTNAKEQFQKKAHNDDDDDDE